MSSLERTVVVRTAQADERVEVNLVPSRDSGKRAVVSAKETDRIRADDLVVLAEQLTTARQLVKGRACDRLQTLAQQMEYLHNKAKQVLEEAARDEELHNVSCNMQKLPGRVYHLYSRSNGQRYFSMLAPGEWGSEAKEKDFIASYRLEFDRSWTPLEDSSKRDCDFEKFEQFLRKGNLPSITTATI